MFRRLLLSMAMLAMAFPMFAADPVKPARLNRPRGAIASDRSKLMAAPRFKAQAVPSFFGVIPPQLSMWGNAQFGCCVSSESAAAKAIFSLMNGGTQEVFIAEATLISWARSHGFLNGAQLTDVMDAMISDGITSGGNTYKDGPYQAVDWTNDAVLSSAIYTGPVKIGVAAGQLENAVGDSNGWILTGARRDQNIDHAVCLCGFGSAADLCKLLGVSVPVSLSPTTRGYLLFTWSTIGFIDRNSMLAITGEAWLRNPTTVGQNPTPTPVPPPTPPTPTPPPTPPVPTPPIVIGPVTIPAGSYDCRLRSGALSGTDLGNVKISKAGKYTVTFAIAP